MANPWQRPWWPLERTSHSLRAHLGAELLDYLTCRVCGVGSQRTSCQRSDREMERDAWSVFVAVRLVPRASGNYREVVQTKGDS